MSDQTTARPRASDDELRMATQMGLDHLFRAISTFALIGRELGMELAPAATAGNQSTEQPETVNDGEN